MSASVYDFECETTAGQKKSLSDYKGKVLLVVNTASKCGFTPQFEGLETLYEAYKDNGLEIIGFPCNQFGKQDPGSNGEITEFCQLNYGVSFPMMAKIDVNGSGTTGLYKHLKKEAPGAPPPRQVNGPIFSSRAGRTLLGKSNATQGLLRARCRVR